MVMKFASHLTCGPLALSLNISHYKWQITGSHRNIYWRAMGLSQEKKTKENSPNLQLSVPYLHARCTCPGAVSQFNESNFKGHINLSPCGEARRGDVKQFNET